MDYLGPYLQSLSQGVQVVQQLRQAADQQQQLAERKRQFDLEQGLRQEENQQRQTQQGLSNQLELHKAGAQPVNDGPSGPTYGGTMSIPQGNLITGMSPDGSMQDVPLPPATQPTNVPVGPQDDIVSTGGKSFRLPTADELAAGAAARKAMEDRTTGAAVPLPAEMASTLYPDGNAPTQVSSGLMSGLQNAYQDVTNRKEIADAKKNPPAKPAPAPKSLHFEKDTNDAGDVTTTGYDPETGEPKSTDVRKGAGAKRKDPNAAGSADKPPTRQQFQQIEQRKQKAIADSAKQYEKDKADPLMGSEEAAGAHIGRLRDAQTAYEQELGALTGNDMGHNDWADKMQPGGQQPAAQAQATPQAPAGPKKASMAQVNAYAKKKGITPAQAVKEFQASKYQVQ